MEKFIAMMASAILLMGQLNAAPKTYTISSPDGQTQVFIECGPDIKYSVNRSGERLLLSASVSVELADGKIWGRDVRPSKARHFSTDAVIPSPFYKKSSVSDKCNGLRIDFRDGFAIEFRVYDDGVAYRFRSMLKRPLKIRYEEATYNMGGDYTAWVPYVRDRPRAKGDIPFDDQFMQSFENTYTKSCLSQMDPERLAFLPVLLESGDGRMICLTDADLEAYPGMFVNNPDGGNSLRAVYAPYPRRTHDGGYVELQSIVDEYEDYIAEIAPEQAFPWRVIAIADNDTALLENDMVYRLASPCRIEDTSWIKPGLVAWDWWNSWGLYGVDFEAGINQRTYEYYIDFAAKWGIPYVLIDDGWTGDDHTDVFHWVPELDLPKLVKYADSKGIGLMLWMGYRPFERDMEELCRFYSDMGIKGFKVDFMDRDDQPVVEYTYKGAETAAKYKLLLDYHGIYKPTGLQRTWPNVINYEGVHGLEQVKWSPVEVDQVTYDVTMPFIRMLAGPVDYTQGAMRNAVKRNFHPVNDEPMSQGTRCRQLAQYVVFDAPLSMLCDSPSNYEREPECLSFISRVPTVWDETKAVDGKVGEFVVTARRYGDEWYIGGMTGWDERSLEIDLSFLGDGDFTLELFIDGPNARKTGRDYTREVRRLGDVRTINVTMMPGGGFAARLVRK